MAHAVQMSDKKRRNIMIGMVLGAFVLIIFGTVWAAKDLTDFANQPEVGSEPPVISTEATPTPTPEPTCAPNEVWSTHASKCYIPEGTSRIDAIPGPEDCVGGQVWSRHASKCYIPTAKNGS